MEDINFFLNSFIYIGLFIDRDERERLINSFLPAMGDVDKVYLDHCTLLFHTQVKSETELDIVKFYLKNKGLKAKILATHIGYSDKAIALKVDLKGIPCSNRNSHITICTLNGGRPVESNNITNWKKIDPFYINTKLDCVFKK